MANRSASSVAGRGAARALAQAEARPAARAWPLLLAALSGGLLGATFLDFGLHPLIWFAFVPLLVASRSAASDRDAAWQGLVAGLAGVVPAFHWLVYTIHVFGGFPYVLAVLFYLCLQLYTAAQFVLFSLAVRRVGFGLLGLAIPTLWVAIEFLYPNLFLWRVANALFEAPWHTQIAEFTGPFGVSFLVLWVNAAIALAVLKPRRALPLFTAGAAALLIAVYGVGRIRQLNEQLLFAPSLRVGLVQGNVGIKEKGNAKYFEINVDRYRKLSEPLQDEVDVLIWPESVSQYWAPADAKRLTGELNPFPKARSYVLFGGLAYEDNGTDTPTSYNSAFLMSSSGEVLGRYDKRILMPFGEYLPGASLFPSLAKLSPQTGSFTPGREIVTLDVPRLVKFAPLICYEDIPVSLARDMTRAGAQVLLTIFNDAWFGRSMAPYQHEALAGFRAIENRRYFVRVGNAGVTSVIDPMGRVVGRLGNFTEEAMTATIRALDIQTFYTKWGDVFGWSIVVIAAGCVVSSLRAAPRPV